MLTLEKMERARRITQMINHLIVAVLIQLLVTIAEHLMSRDVVCQYRDSGGKESLKVDFSLMT